MKAEEEKRWALEEEIKDLRRENQRLKKEVAAKAATGKEDQHPRKPTRPSARLNPPLRLPSSTLENGPAETEKRTLSGFFYGREELPFEVPHLNPEMTPEEKQQIEYHHSRVQPCVFFRSKSSTILHITSISSIFLTFRENYRIDRESIRKVTDNPYDLAQQKEKALFSLIFSISLLGFELRV